MPTTVHVNDDQGMVFFLEPNMKVGVEEIDNDNSKLFAIINELNTELYKNSYSLEKKLSLFNSLIEFGKNHFLIEEQLIKSTNYSIEETIYHLKEHQLFLSKIKQYINEIKNCKMIDVLQFLCEWLNNHILKTDKRFANVYLTKNI